MDSPLLPGRVGELFAYVPLRGKAFGWEGGWNLPTGYLYNRGNNRNKVVHCGGPPKEVAAVAIVVAAEDKISTRASLNFAQ